MANNCLVLFEKKNPLYSEYNKKNHTNQLLKEEKNEVQRVLIIRHILYL